MTKAASLEHALGVQDAAKTMAPGEMCLLFLPRPVFDRLTEIAQKRGMTLAMLMSRALDAYLSPGAQTPSRTEVAPTTALDEDVASFHFTPPSEADPVPIPQSGGRTVLRNFR